MPVQQDSGASVDDHVARLRSSFFETVLRFQKEKITPWVALRNTIGVTLPLIAGIAMGSLHGGLAVSTGALNVSYSDNHEPYIQRGGRMLAASGLVAFAVFGGALLGANHVLAVLAAGLWAFAAGMLVALSATAGDLGVISLVTLVVYSAVPQTPERAVYAGLLAFGGGVFQTLLSVALWPLRRFLPERQALGELFLELARVALQPPQVLAAPPATAQSVNAQKALAPLATSQSVEAERYLVLLSQAERMRLTLMTLARLRSRLERENPQSTEAALLKEFAVACAPVLKALGELLGSVKNSLPLPDVAALEAISDRLHLDEAVFSPRATALARDGRLLMDAFSGQLRAALDLARSATPEGLEAFEQREARRPWRLRLAGTWATLRANLNLESAAFRHAVRLAILVAAGDAFARGLGLHRAYWLPMTIAIVLKPDFTSTFSRGVLRLAGTFVGLVIATVLFHVLPAGDFTRVALLAVLMFLLRSFGSGNYGLFVMFITALVVVLMALSGVPPSEVIAARAVNTVAGGVIALLAYWLWPTWERSHLPEAIAQLLDQYRAYFRIVRTGYETGSSSAFALDRARNSARIARTNLEGSAERLAAEPGTPPDRLRTTRSLLASLHRLAHALMALESGLLTHQPSPPREAFTRFANDIELTLHAFAGALRGSPVSENLPSLREDYRALVQHQRYALMNVELDRITNTLNTIAEELPGFLGRRIQ